MYKPISLETKVNSNNLVQNYDYDLAKTRIYWKIYWKEYNEKLLLKIKEYSKL